MLHEFELESGTLTGNSIFSNGSIEVGSREGFGWVEGVKDPESQRVDLEVLLQIESLERQIEEGGEGELLAEVLETLRARLLVEYIPASPGDDYEWIAERKRWRIRPEVSARQRRHSAAISDIERLERASLRPLREFRIAEAEGRAPPEAAAARLKEIEEQIEALRLDL